ncbi:nucleotidyltransferase family protein [Gemmiger formicilis]|uniref:nucleotidyltransferase family protein n=1 Tax=Gemmiger formicilis TaxID=745368 RepID=UPI00195C6243|nr:nucleotidyltransferase family protein [Gemmiger formicilis]MBM6715601.1 nucleotidyltransferase family protein [Gemmiger formicilis]
MKFAGIITEYDPFHNGHATQLQMLRQRGAETIAVCMSSGAVQRGGVPLFPESVRVRAALLGGADLVVALPAPYANTGAEAFAAAGVALLTALGCDTLAFGAEDPDADRLLQAARLLEAPDLSARLRGYLGQGMTFAAARAKAAEELEPGLSDLLSRPNNILGIEYCKALLAQHSPMQPLALHRLGADHGSVQPGRAGQTLLASASFLRAAVRRGGVEALAPYVPEPAMEVYRHAAAQGLTMDAGRFSLALLTLLRAGDPARFARVRGVNEGLEHRLSAAVRQASDAEDLYARLKTKRYPHARLRRLALDAAIGVEAGSLPELPPYLHVLGARRAALPLLRNAAMPVSTSLSKLEQALPQAENLIKMHNSFTDFSALCREQTQPMGLAYTAKPVVL